MEHKYARRALIAVDGFAGITALIGMVMLLADWPLRWPTSDLANTPFADYTVPALILGLVVGGSALVAMGAMLARAHGGPALSFIAGAIMIGWILVECALLPSSVFVDFAKNWAQAEYLLVGVAMVVLAVRVAPGGWRGMLPRRTHRGQGAVTAP